MTVDEFWDVLITKIIWELPVAVLFPSWFVWLEDWETDEDWEVFGAYEDAETLVLSLGVEACCVALV